MTYTLALYNCLLNYKDRSRLGYDTVSLAAVISRIFKELTYASSADRSDFRKPYPKVYAHGFPRRDNTVSDRTT